MATEIVMPKLGLTMTEGLINDWLVKEGDTVAAGQPVLEISSEKLTSEVEAPSAGVILKIISQSGETVPCKQVIAWIGEAGESLPGAEAAVQEGQSEDSTAAAALPEKNSEESPKTAAARELGGRIFITPLARKMAKEKGYDISLIAGSGGNGRITRRDVENYQPQAVPASQATAVSAAEVQTAADYGAGLTGMRKTIAERMMASLQTSAQVTLHRKADISRLMVFRQDMKAQVSSPLENGEISITTLLTKAAAKALKEHPQLNAWYFNGHYQELEEVHIGIATALSDGLVVPVIRQVDKLTLSDLGAAIKNETQQARKGRLDPALYTGSTFSITNLGAADIEYFTPILNTPEVAILGVGALQKTLALDAEGQICEKHFLPLSLTFDHQVVDGQPAAEFLAGLADKLENPYDLLF
ncbi:Dihydrolipoamide acetyltransferase component (E2) of acetoin dehydrogenase complex [Streptococcus sp. DD11]|uniref:dihydrolipoamide acetyltransferase family protein n=1 Tax=Streptococcus sp. DD11 TaxID=1777879 RepID=UPI00079ABF11|nr:dihydrolipoamide acetyltransferase family protein [Streptococcus sp. DD11]KXT77347.1 Dihydrolipoamide acetyltransferase component (E2) of acetoin dehydrogenase complex [Streptococcus sp. DD11]